MKKPNILGVLFIALFVTHLGWAQDLPNGEPDCQKRLEIAEVYLPFLHELTDTHKLELLTSLTTCIDKGNSQINYAYGVVLLNTRTTASDKQKALAYIEKAARNGIAEAASKLGVLKKREGELTTSFQWFTESANKGGDLGKYALGYYHMKGIGGAEQDYAKAISYFESSNDPMAKHWLGVCHYFGFGVVKDEHTGLKMIKRNKTVNSRILAEALESGTATHTPDNSGIPDLEYDNLTYQELVPKPCRLVTSYTGKLVEYDWSGTKVLRTSPVTLSLSYESSRQSITYDLSFGDRGSRRGTVSDIRNISFNGLVLDMTPLFPDNEEVTTLSQRIPTANFRILESGRASYLTAKLSSQVLDWAKEPGEPKQIILEASRGAAPLLPNVSSPLDCPTIDNVDNRSLKIFPNPFQSNFTVEYEVTNRSSIVSLKLQSLGVSGIQRTLINNVRQSGKNSITVSGNDLPQGLYFITLYEDGKPTTKEVVKN